ncbi:MAG: hypothetical protein ONB46_22850 [candidate division KSB1 bacterium]|nr:hypothetical protein [candidate division KSB1 bacterium]MDZ7368666.1 hypothetical protein [candidate division KSB1 bacterium]MDZ7406481.1 hypothetical protein [candidate division KSB1 bacterium]
MLFRNLFAKLGQYSNLILAFIGSVSFVLYLFLSRLGIANAPDRITEILRHFFVLLAALFVLLLAAAMTVKAAAPNRRDKRIALLVIFAGAVLFRLALLGQSPWLSNDVYRYLWDAQLVDHGVNPYSFPPEAEELAGFRDATIYPKMDHKNVHSVYPPFLQLLFWTGRKIGQLFDLQSFIGLKLIFVLADLCLVLVLFRLLEQVKLDPRWAILYAWHPLPIVEIAGSGHTDGAGALTLVFALIFLLQQKYFFATIFLALSFLIKFFAVLFLPFILLAAWKDLNLKQAWQLAALFILIIAVSYAPFAAAGEKLWSGLQVYSDKWRFNDGFFSLIFSAVHFLLPDGLVKSLMIPPHWDVTIEALTTRRIDLALIISKAICGGVFMFVYVRLLWRTFKFGISEVDGIAVFIVMLSAFFLLSPTLQPWYLIWLLPFLCLQFENRVTLYQSLITPLWLLSATVFLSYWVLESYVQSGLWQEPGWVKWAEYGIPVGAWLWRSNKLLI